MHNPAYHSAPAGTSRILADPVIQEPSQPLVLSHKVVGSWKGRRRLALPHELGPRPPEATGPPRRPAYPPSFGRPSTGCTRYWTYPRGFLSECSFSSLARHSACSRVGKRATSFLPKNITAITLNALSYTPIPFRVRCNYL